MNDWKVKVTAELDTAELEQQVNQKINELNGKKVKFGVDGGNAQKEVEKVDNSIKSATKSTKTFGDTLKTSAKLGAAYSITSQAFQAIREAASAAKEAVQEFDAAVMDLRMATGGTYTDVSNLVKEYNELGQAIGATTKEISSGADSWLRQGHSISDTNILIKDSMILSKVAELESAEATQYLTSAMKGYKVEVEDVIGIVDKLTAVDLVSATEAGGLAEAMSRTAASADIAGVSMDKLLGYLAATGEVTQKSMTSIGESYKTIFTRMGDIKSGKLQFIDEDGTAESLSDVETVLNNLGIKLRDSNNEFRNFGDVLDEVGAAWDDYSTVQKAAISKAFAGTRQSENFKVLMENYGKATEYMEVSMNSAGTAEQKFEAYLDSLEAKTKSLQASFESLAINTFSTEMFGGIIDATSSVVTFLDKTNLLKGTLVGLTAAGAIKAFTMLTTGITNASIRLNEFNSALKLVKAGNIGEDKVQMLAKMTANLSQSQLKAVLSSKALSGEQRIAILTAQGLTKSEAEAALASMGLATAEGAATTSTFTLTGALKGLWATLMSNPLILIATAVAAVVTIFSSMAQAAEEAQQLAIDSGKAAAESANDLYAALTKYMELKEAIDNGTGSSEEFAAAQQDVLDALGMAGEGIDTLIEKYGTLHEAIVQTSKEKLDTDISVALAGVESASKKAGKDLESWLGTSISTGDVDIFKSLAEAGYISSGSYGSKGGQFFVPNSDMSDVWSDLSLQDALENYQFLEDVMNHIRNEFGTDNDTFKKVAEAYNKYASALDPVIEQIDSANELVAKRLMIDADKEVNNYDDFVTLRNDLITKLSENKDFKEGGESAASIIDALLGSDSDYSEYYDRFTELEELAAKEKKIREKFNSSKWIQDASWNIAEGRLNDFNDWFEDLSDEDKTAVYDIVCNTDTAEWNLQDWQNALAESKEYTAQSLTQIEDKYKSATESTKVLADGISSVQDVLSSQSTGESISIDDFNSDELIDYTSALEYHNGVLQLNAEKVREIVEAKSDEQIEINNTNKVMAQSKYLENAAQIEKYRKELKDSTSLTDEQKESIQGKIDVLLEENAAIKLTCDSYDIMTSSLEEATNAYNNWLNAQNASQSGDMFDDTLDAITRINETLNDTDSEYFGRVGRTDYQAALELIIPDTIGAEDTEKVNSYLKSVYDLFTYDDEGNYSGLNIANFCQKAVDAGLMVLDESGENYQIAGSKTMEDFAEGLNLSLPLVQAMFGEMEEFGGEFSWADEANKTIGDLAVSANVAAENLRGLHSDMKITLDVSDLTTAKEKSDALDSTIKQMQDLKTKVGVDSEEVEYANSIISYCITQKQQLSEPAILDVDVSKVSETTGEAVLLIQDFQKACNDLELKKALGLDTTDAQAKVDELYSQITSSDNDALLALKLDTTSVETVKSSIAGLTIDDIKTKLQIDDTALLSYQPEDKQATVTYDIDTTKVDNYNPKNLSRTVTYYVSTVGSVKANGTANLTGTAKAGGDWGTAQGGQTLTGELGREIVVDPHTGRWYTVGDTGAEFVNIPKGAIVFNHKQTESLLKNGYVAGRASALVGGTAMVTGGIGVGNANSSTTSGGNSTDNYGKSSSSNKSSSSSNKSTNNAEDELKAFDWIEIAIERIEQVIDRLKATATSTYKALKTKLGATADEISVVNQELALQQQAYNRYMQEANSVGLSSDLAEKVRAGSIQISEYDEDTQKLIKSYSDWYEKAIECSDAIDELHQNLAELYEDNFDNIQDDFNSRLGLIEHSANQYDTGIELLETKGYLESLDYYIALQDVEKQRIAMLNKELAGLTQAFSDAMNSGEIEKYSESWFEMQDSINGVKEEIAEANVELAEYAKTMREIEWGYFDYTQERISQLTQEADFLIDLMSNSDLHTDRGQLTDEGMATMGLHGQNYNVYMAQASMYAEELAEINAQLANDPYNTELIERREELLALQQESIIAAEDEKQAIVSLVEEGIALELESLQELIDAYNDSLDSAKNLYEYEKKISQQTQNIGNLKKQLSAYENDLSQETRAKVQKLTVELAEANEELEQTEYDKMVSDTREILDSLYLEYEAILNSRLDSVDGLIGDMITAVNDNSGLINETLITTANDVGYTMTTNMQSIWNGATGALDGTISKYGDDFSTKFTAVQSVLNSIQANTAAMVAASDEEAQETVDNTNPETTPSAPTTPPSTTPSTQPTTPTTPEKTITIGGKINAKGAKIYDYAGDNTPENQYFRNDPIYTVLDEKSGYLKVRHHKLSSGVTGWFKKSDVKAYKTGGLVDYTGLAKVDGTPGKPELMLNAEDTKNFLELRDVLREMALQELSIGSKTANADYGIDASPRLTGITDISGKLAQLKNNTVSQSHSVTFGDTNINIDHVDDYNDFVTKLQHDGKFEDMILAMTADRMLGGSSLGKYKNKWK